MECDTRVLVAGARRQPQTTASSELGLAALPVSQVGLGLEALTRSGKLGMWAQGYVHATGVCFPVWELRERARDSSSMAEFFPESFHFPGAHMALLLQGLDFGCRLLVIQRESFIRVCEFEVRECLQGVIAGGDSRWCTEMRFL